MTAIALASGTVTWQFSLPSHATLRYFQQLFLVCPAEEGFYRGFIQNELSQFLKNSLWGKAVSLIITSSVFTFSHIFLSPDIGTLLFVFLAGLLYVGVYMILKRIESAILCHFVLNFIHMTFFNYHAA